MIEPRATRCLPAVDAVIGKIVAVHALLMSESDISPRNQKIGIALRELVELLLKSYDPAETAAILNHAEVAALRISLLARLSKAELALERYWSQRFITRKSLGVSDLTEFLYWRNYERLLGLELQALTAMWRRLSLRKNGGIAFVGAGPLPLCCTSGPASLSFVSMRMLKPVKARVNFCRSSVSMG